MKRQFANTVSVVISNRRTISIAVDKKDDIRFNSLWILRYRQTGSVGHIPRFPMEQDTIDNVGAIHHSDDAGSTGTSEEPVRPPMDDVQRVLESLGQARVFAMVVATDAFLYQQRQLEAPDAPEFDRLIWLLPTPSSR